MSYTTAKLTTAAQCDEVLEMATDKKSDLQFEFTSLSRNTTGAEKSSNKRTATLAAINAQMAGFTAALAVLTDPVSIKEMNSRIRKLNDRKENLEEMAEKSSTSVFMEHELDLALLSKQIAEVDVFAAEVTAHKATL